MSDHPYETWETRRLLGVMRHVDTQYNYWTSMFSNQMTFDTEWVDFEKLERRGRKLAAFVRPKGRGMPVYSDSTRVFRFKPAYIKARDEIDPFMPLTARPGLDTNLLDQDKMTPEQRLNLIRAAMVQAHVDAIQARWEWMACQAIVDASIIVEGDEYPREDLDFLRAANHSVTLGAGSRWGDSGISIFDSLQTYCDRMFEAEFGGFPTRLTITPKVWKVMRQDEEIMGHMDTNYRDPRATVERGLISGERIVDVGELLVGGNSGGRIQITLYNDRYENSAGGETRFLADGTAVLTSSPERIMGYRCFGAIIDRMARYQSMPIFPRNWVETNADPVQEVILHQSAPLMVPINPNATFKLIPVDPS